MASTTVKRLRSVFSRLPTRVTPAIPKPTSDILNPGNPISNDQSTNPDSSQEPSVESIVKKFKNSSDSKRFRKRNFYYETTVRSLSSRGQFSAIHDILEHQKMYPEITDERFAVRLIRLYGKAKMVEEAQKLFDELPSLECQRTVLSFNALLASCVDSKDFDKVTELFHEMPEKLSLQPNIVSYNTAIKALCDGGSADSAVAVMDEMEKNDVKPDTVTFNTLLDALYNMKRFSMAEKMWSLMEQKHVVANVRSYNSRLRGLVAEDRISEAVELIEEMSLKGVEPDNYSYNAMIKGFVDDGNLKEAKKWYRKMVARKCRPDKVTFSFLIPFACNKDDCMFAYELCKKCIEMKQTVYNSVLQRVVDGLVARLMDDEAEKLRKMAKFE